MAAVLQISGIQKSYQSLRPLRLQQLTIDHGERVALAGLDAGAAEVMVNLVTGASLPDHGEVRVLDRPTSAIVNGDEWLASLDRFGIISPRGVLVEGLTIEQNIAMVFTLEIEPVPRETAVRVAALAADCGIGDVRGLTGEATPEVRARLHLARAIALSPALLILEHPTAGIPDAARDAYAETLVAVTETRRLAALVMTQDEAFAVRAGHRAFRLEPATGALKPVRRGWFR
ncbi:MAG TPA: ATP-binding cassette domain-containing protein [Vicinamibacterales bacterium]|nr:ATP-binding cassette domain-containing protein [Vicinamibacterales bacterium]